MKYNNRTFLTSCLAAFSLLILSLAPGQFARAWGNFDGGHHPAYGGQWAHHDPVVIHNTYVSRGGGGCIGCGAGAVAVAGLVGGAIIGAAIVSNAQPRTVVVQQAPTTVVVQGGYPPGTEMAALPGGCASMNVNGVNYYQCGPTWFQPFFGGNGVYYTVVPAP